MIIVKNPNRKLRPVYAWREENGEFLLSPFAEARGKWRPVGRYDSKEETEAIATARGLDLIWLTTVLN